MNIQILHLIEGAKQAKSVAVIIDVFRAFSVEAYLMDGGAETIFPVGDINFAYQYKKDHPEILLVGERHGVMCEGFDLGNSPTQAVNTDVRGKTILHTTSAGTQGIANAMNADVVMTGSLVNAKAIARYIKSLNPTDVSLVCMGLEAVEPSEEDTMCAEYIKSLLEDAPIDLTDRIEGLKTTRGKKFFDPARQSVFPESDFHYCVDVNKFDFVLRVEKNADGLMAVKKIPV